MVILIQARVIKTTDMFVCFPNAGSSVFNRTCPSVQDIFIRWRGIHHLQVRFFPFFPYLAIPHTSTESEHFCSCIRGRLIEVNENILSNPALLQEKVRHFLVLYFSAFISLLTSVLLFSHQLRGTLQWFYPNLKKARV